MDINGDAPEIVGRVRRRPNFRLRSTPERLLNAALDEFIRLRFDKVRVEHITGRLGLTKTALYAHFANKRAIFDRVIEEFCLPADGTQYGDQTLAEMLGADPARKVLRIVLREWPSIPELGPQYLDAVVTKLVSQAVAPDADAARRLASAALSPLAMRLLFFPPASPKADDV